MEARPHCVIDGAFDPELVRKAAAEWPNDRAPWVEYSTKYEQKTALHQWEFIPPACASLLRQMADLPVPRWLGIEATPDLSLYGAGLHAMEPGDKLGIHLDADRHKLLGTQRLANAILFLSDWRPEWGGCLVLHTSRPPLRIAPAFNRLVVFGTDDRSRHEVERVLSDNMTRKTLALYWWGPAQGESKRPRAVFYDARGEAVAR